MNPDIKDLVVVIGQLAFCVSCVGAGIIFAILSHAHIIRRALLEHGMFIRP
jgi:hypothetical protein